MVVPKTLQLYFGTSQIFGHYGDPWEVRGGENWYSDEGARPPRQRRVDLREQARPVGYTAYPYPVGAKGTVFHINLEMNF